MNRFKLMILVCAFLSVGMMHAGDAKRADQIYEQLLPYTWIVSTRESDVREQIQTFDAIATEMSAQTDENHAAIFATLTMMSKALRDMRDQEYSLGGGSHSQSFMSTLQYDPLLLNRVALLKSSLENLRSMIANPRYNIDTLRSRMWLVESTLTQMKTYQYIPLSRENLLVIMSEMMRLHDLDLEHKKSGQLLSQVTKAIYVKFDSFNAIMKKIQEEGINQDFVKQLNALVRSDSCRMRILGMPVIDIDAICVVLQSMVAGVEKANIDKRNQQQIEELEKQIEAAISKAERRLQQRLRTERPRYIEVIKTLPAADRPQVVPLFISIIEGLRQGKDMAKERGAFVSLLRNNPENLAPFLPLLNLAATLKPEQQKKTEATTAPKPLTTEQRIDQLCEFAGKGSETCTYIATNKMNITYSLNRLIKSEKINQFDAIIKKIYQNLESELTTAERRFLATNDVLENLSNAFYRDMARKSTRAMTDKFIATIVSYNPALAAIEQYKEGLVEVVVRRLNRAEYLNELSEIIKQYNAQDFAKAYELEEAFLKSKHYSPIFDTILDKVKEITGAPKRQ